MRTMPVSVDTFRSQPAPAGMTHDATAETWCVWMAVPDDDLTGWLPWQPLLRWDFLSAADAHAEARHSRQTWHGHLFAVRRGNTGAPRPTAKGC